MQRGEGLLLGLGAAAVVLTGVFLSVLVACHGTPLSYFGLGFGAASILAGQLAGVIPVHFELGGATWTNLHVLFLLSALGRLASAGLTLRLHDPRARGTVRELVTALADRLGVGAVRPYLPALVRIPRR